MMPTEKRLPDAAVLEPQTRRDSARPSAAGVRLFRRLFETYCRIHQTIDIKLLAEQLNMSAEHAERWLVNLVREARLDAKIDSEANHVLMTP